MEFGIDLPEMGKLVAAFSCEASKFFIFYVSLVFLSVVGVEFARLLVPRGFARKVVKVRYWSLFAIMILCFDLVIFTPTVSMVWR